MANEIYILQDRCTGCGSCVKVCPVNCISMSDRPKQEGVRWKKLATIDVNKCVFCNACVEDCDKLFEKTKVKVPNPDFFHAIVMKKEEVKVQIDTASYKGVWCFAEQRHGRLMPTIFELLHVAKKLSSDLNEDLSAVLMGHQVSQYAQDILEHGADKVYVLDHPIFEHFLDEVYTCALTDLIKREKPNKLLMPASIIGRSFASRVAIAAQTGITADATELSINQKNRTLHATRPSFGGNLMATILCEKHRPEMATVRPMSFPRAARQPGRKGEIVRVTVDPSQWNIRSKFVKYEAEKNETIDITAAEKIVSGGRGLGKPEGFKIIEEFAQTIGAAVGASRPTVDAGWIPYKHQVGLTGRTVRPKLYIACGISGQIQHLAGMSSAEVVIAINKDPECPMFKLATLSVEGDLYELIPLIIQEIKRVRDHK
ncbi:MAG: electron transfer flavoprotein subunit alpha [Elusimicrobia bacterium]|nr:electron transfer flavoprotein subunit alpha [Elusimicrobiota bacterium]MBI4218344.1 electron transfer flavoprotein subunit alpha [Elusimicrobiota bacterium]